MLFLLTNGMNKWVLLGGISLGIVIILVVVFTQIRQNIYQSPGNNTAVCNSLVYNGKDKVNIVFLASKDIASQYTDYFLNSTPYNQDKTGFNFYYIDYEPKCDLYQGVALFCYNQEVIKTASSCPNDYIVVVKSNPVQIRSSSYMNVISINKNSPETVVLHEFGHAFGNLADEYSPANLVSGQKNCVSDCNSFGGAEGCFDGCSTSSLHRSIDNGVMRTLNAEDYGSFDDGILLKRMGINTQSITGNAIVENGDCTNERYYLIQGNYDSETINVTDRSVEQGCVGSTGYGGFDYKMTLNNGQTIGSGNLNLEAVFTDAPEVDQLTGGVLPYVGTFYIKVPIVTNMQTLEISKEGKVLSDINLAEAGARPCKI